MPKYVVHRWLHSMTEVEAGTKDQADQEAARILDANLLESLLIRDTETTFVFTCGVSKDDFVKPLRPVKVRKVKKDAAVSS